VQDGGFLIVAVDAIAREATLFAALWFLVGGIDDLAIDLVYLARCVRMRLSGRRAPVLDSLTSEESEGPLAIFVAAWDESAVIGAMLRAALTRFDHPDYRIYVGTYPNDLATVRAVADVAAQDRRVRLVIGGADGPTTKADCLNAVWRALLRDEAAEGMPTRAVILHDAEDLVHPGELRVFDHYLADHHAVQLPVLPLRHRKSPMVSGHYIDEFTESHGKQIVVRQFLGAALPFAGVGCAIRRDMIGRIAASRGGAPFDATSLTEDYELGLTVAEMGGRSVLARVSECSGGPPVAVRAYFPASFKAAARQKARWMTGIALAGWDRVGWSGGLFEHWMRARDRRAILAIPVLVVAYLALFAWVLSLATHRLGGTAPPAIAPALELLLLVNCVLLAWRVAVRAWFVHRIYGRGEALLSVPRMLVANIVALAAARRATSLYFGMLAGGAPRWDKTRHEFPDDPEGAAA